MSEILLQLDVDLLKAKVAWDTLAETIGAKYTVAYAAHKDVLEATENARKAELEQYYFILGLVAVAVSGGLAGGLMAPWVKGAGDFVAGIVIRNAISGMSRQIVQRLYQRVVQLAQQNAVSSSPYTPKVQDPLLYYQNMKTELGLCFTGVLSAIDDLTTSKEWDHRHDKQLADNFRKTCVLITDQPDFGYMNHLKRSGTVERAMELAMWVAWANARDMKYWTEAYNMLDKGDVSEGIKYFSDARDHLGLVLDEMSNLLVENKVSMDWRGNKILDIRKLQKLDMSILDVYKGLPGATFDGLKVGNGRNVLNAGPIQQVRPHYKR